MSGTITLGNETFNYVYKGHFKTLFPGTSNYLNFILPLRHPSLLSSYTFKLKDVPVYFVFGDLEEFKKGKLAGFSYGVYFQGTPTIIIDLKYISSYALDKTVPSKERDFTSAFCARLAKRFDRITKYRSILIHEYEHFVQDLYNLSLDSEDYKVSRALANFTDYDCKPLAKELLSSNEVSVAEKTLHELNEYSMSPDEIEARLSQWIFLLIKGHSVKSIKSFEKDIFGPVSHKIDSTSSFFKKRSEFTRAKTKVRELKRLIPHQKKMSDYYRDRKDIPNFYLENKKLESMNNEFFSLKEKLPLLERHDKKLHVATVYFTHMMNEAEHVSKLFKKRYSHLVDTI